MQRDGARELGRGRFPAGHLLMVADLFLRDACGFILAQYSFIPGALGHAGLV